MQLEIKKLIYDIDQAVTLITDFIAGKQITNYAALRPSNDAPRFMRRNFSPLKPQNTPNFPKDETNLAAQDFLNEALRADITDPKIILVV